MYKAVFRLPFLFSELRQIIIMNNKIMIGNNNFNFLNRLHEEMKLNEAYDKEIERLRENKIRYNSFTKEREARLNAERKRKNTGE